MLSSIAATGPPTVVTKDAVLIRHHHLTLFWKYQPTEGDGLWVRWDKVGIRGQSYHYLNVTIICLEYPGKQPTFYYQKKKPKTKPQTWKTQKGVWLQRNRQFIERILEHLKRSLTTDMSTLITRSHFGCTKLAKIKTSNSTHDGKAK